MQFVREEQRKSGMKALRTSFQECRGPILTQPDAVVRGVHH